MRDLTIRKSNIAFFGLITILAVFVSLRGGTRDTSAYLEIFKNIDTYFSFNPVVFYEKAYVEIGYGIVAMSLAWLGSYQILFFAISFATFFFIKRAADLFRVNGYFVLFCYLPTFFAYHQLMQIRQGLAVAIVYYVLAIVLTKKRERLKGISFSVIAVSFHYVALVMTPVFILFSSRFIRGLSNKSGMLFKVVALLLMIIFCSRLIMNMGWVELVARASVYSGSAEYAATRSFFHPVNLRAVLLLVLFLTFCPRNNDKVFNGLLLVFTVGVGVRLGLYDFVLLSGRLGTVFTFAEVFVIPILLQQKFTLSSRIFLLSCYFIASVYILLQYQVPFIIEDYFTPLP